MTGKAPPEPRQGISTGTCAAAAAKAAATERETGTAPAAVTVSLPCGETEELDIIRLPGGRFGVIKDAGDEMDATDGVVVAASVEIYDRDGPVTFKAGEGVGTVTLPGLKIPPDEPAINPVPREMIERAVRDIVGKKAASVTIYIPGGEEIAERTFNKRLGIEGGLSILGTSGRVRSMDKNSLHESISLELSTHAARSRSCVALTFASTGEAAARTAWGLRFGLTVQVANEIGFALGSCVKLGLRRVIVAGHPGKMLKIAAGSFDTNNRISDGRFEALCTHTVLATRSCEHVEQLYSCSTTEAAMALMEEKFTPEARGMIWNSLASRAAERCKAHVFGGLEVAAAFLDNAGRVLGASENIADFVKELSGQ